MSWTITDGGIKTNYSFTTPYPSYYLFNGLNSRTGVKFLFANAFGIDYPLGSGMPPGKAMAGVATSASPSVYVSFGTSFSYTPQVIVTHLDNQSANWNSGYGPVNPTPVVCGVGDISASGFTLYVGVIVHPVQVITFGVNGLKVSWIAKGY
jgi:hypothetical protein